MDQKQVVLGADEPLHKDDTFQSLCEIVNFGAQQAREGTFDSECIESWRALVCQNHRGFVFEDHFMSSPQFAWSDVLDFVLLFPHSQWPSKYSNFFHLLHRMCRHMSVSNVIALVHRAIKIPMMEPRTVELIQTMKNAIETPVVANFISKPHPFIQLINLTQPDADRVVSTLLGNKHDCPLDIISDAGVPTMVLNSGMVVRIVHSSRVLWHTYVSQGHYLQVLYRKGRWLCLSHVDFETDRSDMQWARKISTEENENKTIDCECKQWFGPSRCTVWEREGVISILTCDCVQPMFVDLHTGEELEFQLAVTSVSATTKKRKTIHMGTISKRNICRVDAHNRTYSQFMIYKHELSNGKEHEYQIQCADHTYTMDNGSSFMVMGDALVAFGTGNANHLFTTDGQRVLLPGVPLCGSDIGPGRMLIMISNELVTLDFSDIKNVKVVPHSNTKHTEIRVLYYSESEDIAVCFSSWRKVMYWISPSAILWSNPTYHRSVVGVLIRHLPSVLVQMCLSYCKVPSCPSQWLLADIQVGFSGMMYVQPHTLEVWITDKESEVWKLIPGQKEPIRLGHYENRAPFHGRQNHGRHILFVTKHTMFVCK